MQVFSFLKVVYSGTFDGVQWSMHAPAALPPGKEPPVTTGLEVGWAPVLFWTRR
jgi:hypothetical protein